MAAFIGIDLNGLSDVSARDGVAGAYRGGDVPSVVVLPKDEAEGRNGLTVVAGEEASRGIEGRGWRWPESARVVEGASRRLPVAWLLKAIQEGEPVPTPGGNADARTLLGAAVQALAGAGAQEPDSRVVMAIPDDGTYTEEIRQRLLDSAANYAIRATLVWRPVAAFLALESQLRHVAGQLKGKSVGIISLMNEGVQVNRLEVESTEKGADVPYLVPVRKEAGISVAYRMPILELAQQAASRMMPNDADGAWQVLWGDGLVLGWLLGLKERPSLLQRPEGWSLHSGRRRADCPLVELGEAAIRDILSYLGDIRYVIYEGPAFAAPTTGNLALAHHLQSVLFSHRKQSLQFADLHSHLAAHGCAVYAQRKADGMLTYFDYLPQMRLAVRKGEQPEFVELMPRDGRVEGGELFTETKDLGVSIPVHAQELRFYLLREGAVAPRFVSLQLPVRPAAPLPVSMIVRQRPAQGLAELTLEATDSRAGFPSVRIGWGEMQPRPGQSEEQILAELRQSGIEVPHVVPQPCHAAAWTVKRTGSKSLVEIVENLDKQLSKGMCLFDDVKELGNALTPFLPLAVLTSYTTSDFKRYRPVSSDGDLPEASPYLSQETLLAFDRVLEGLGGRLANAPTDLRTAIVRTVTWAFRRCPDEVLKHLAHSAFWATIPNSFVYYRAMGRSFIDESDFKAFFAAVEQDVKSRGSIKQQHLEGLRYLLSLREEAALALSGAQAELLADAVVKRLQEMVRLRKNKRLMRETLRTLAAMLRFRLVDHSFATPGEARLGDRVATVAVSVSEKFPGTPAALLAESLLEWVQKRGTDQTILQWEDENDENGTAPSEA